MQSKTSFKKMESYWIGLNDIENPDELVWLEDNRKYTFRLVSFY